MLVPVFPIAIIKNVVGDFLSVLENQRISIMCYLETWDNENVLIKKRFSFFSKMIFRNIGVN